MTPARWDREIRPGDVVSLPLRLRGPASSVNLTGASVEVDPPTAPVQVIVENPQQGLMRLRLGPAQPGTYRYALRVSWPNGDRWTVLEGYLAVRGLERGA